MAKLQCGISLHQMPRNLVIRSQVIPPPGYMLCEHDFSGQESRFMACYSGDKKMLEVLGNEAPHDDLHGYTGSQLAHRSFEGLIKCLHMGKDTEEFKQAKNDRYLGKFANLSLQYRTGAKKLMSNARIQYKLPMLLMEAQRVKQQYEQTYPGIPEYWRLQIQFAKAHGYVESFAGKRYRFPKNAWERERTWSSESTSLNWPIQNAGASQKSLAMKYLIPYLKEIGGLYYFELHDGIYTCLPEDTAYEEALIIKEMLSNLDYTKEWGYTPPIQFPVDASIGYSWEQLKEI